MKRRLLWGTLSVVALLLMPEMASAARPATDQEIAEFRTSAKAVENAPCAVALRATSSDICPAPRADYEPTITEARVSTIDETWATAHLAPVPKSTKSATAIFRREAQQSLTNGVPESLYHWYMITWGTGCEPAERAFGANHGVGVYLVPDLVLAMGCTVQVPTKVRCLDKFRTSLLALVEPRQCAVAGPSGSPFAGWMNIRDLRWHRWGATRKAWALGVIRQVPQRLMRGRFSTPTSQPGIGAAVPLAPLSVRLVASGRVSCGTSYFYSKLRVVSPFGRFAVALPTCPDQFFSPR